MNAFTDIVRRRLLLLLLIQVLPSLSISVNIDRNVNNIVAKTKIPITPQIIDCFLNDVVKLSVPVINENDQYFITRPNGEQSKIDLRTPKTLNGIEEAPFKSLHVSFIENSSAIIWQANNNVFEPDELDEKLKHLESNEFLVGPLLEHDYGNWVLSTYTKDLNDEWIELFQVITMDIKSLITLQPAKPRLYVGDTFNLSFPYAFPDIVTCEVLAPKSTYDRFYSRSSTNFKKCGFTIPNLTKEDQGVWKIIGVGNIVYEGEVMLEVMDRPKSTIVKNNTLQSLRMRFSQNIL